MEEKIGFLIFDTKTSRDGNVGGGIIRRVLQRGGYVVEDCAPQEIDNYALVLLSIPSTYQIIDVLRAALKYSFASRKCKILVGGFGCQNISAISEYVDFAYYGRGHREITAVVEDILKTGKANSRHVLDVKKPHPVVVNTDAPLYSDSVITESFAGCRNMCKFCHYCHVRKAQGDTGGTYIQGMLTGGNSPEVLLKDIRKMATKPGRVRTAIDGFSQKLRMLYGKRISNEEIIQAINHLGSLKESRGVNQFNIFGGVDRIEKKETVVVLAYNIGHMPGETERDELELHKTLNSCYPRERVVVIVHTTPFRPSLLTPMQWSEVRLFPQWSDKRELVVCDRGNLLAKYSFTLEGAFSHLSSVVIDRYGVYGQDDIVLEALLAGKGKNAKEKAELLLDAGGDKYAWRLNISKHDPLPWVSLPSGKKKLMAMARSLP